MWFIGTMLMLLSGGGQSPLYQVVLVTQTSLNNQNTLIPVVISEGNLRTLRFWLILTIQSTHTAHTRSVCTVAVTKAGQGLVSTGPLTLAYQLSRLHLCLWMEQCQFLLLFRDSEETFGSVGNLEVTYLPGQKPLSTEERSMCASLGLQVKCRFVHAEASFWVSLNPIEIDEIP